MHSRQRKFKLAAALAGAGVLVTMGVVTLSGTGNELNITAPAAGETSTQQTAPANPQVSKATPKVTATTSEGEWAPLAPAE